MRLQKYLAEAGVASRRASEKLIEEGKVKVNGSIINTQGFLVDCDKDVVEYNGKIVSLITESIYFMLNKPVRVVTTASDEKNRKTVLDIMPKEIRIFPVGRLDYMSSGLLLLTNDGELTYRLTHPKHSIAKRYIVMISPKITQKEERILMNGMDLGIYKISSCDMKLLKEDSSSQTYEITIYEGKNRQIRRMFEAVGSMVKRLKRVAVGDLVIGDLKTGEYRELTKKEIDYLKSL